MLFFSFNSWATTQTVYDCEDFVALGSLEQCGVNYISSIVPSGSYSDYQYTSYSIVTDYSTHGAIKVYYSFKSYAGTEWESDLTSSDIISFTRYDVEVFVVDDDLIAEYFALAASLSGDWSMCSGESCDIPNTLELLMAESEYQTSLNQLAQQVADSNKITAQASAVSSLSASNPDLTALANNSTLLNQLATDTSSVVDSSFSSAQTMSDALNSGESVYDLNSLLYQSQYDDAQEISALTSTLETAATQEEFDSIVAQITALDTGITENETTINTTWAALESAA